MLDCLRLSFGYSYGTGIYFEIRRSVNLNFTDGLDQHTEAGTGGLGDGGWLAACMLCMAAITLAILMWMPLLLWLQRRASELTEPISATYDKTITTRNTGTQTPPPMGATDSDQRETRHQGNQTVGTVGARMLEHDAAWTAYCNRDRGKVSEGQATNHQATPGQGPAAGATMGQGTRAAPGARTVPGARADPTPAGHWASPGRHSQTINLQATAGANSGGWGLGAYLDSAASSHQGNDSYVGHLGEGVTRRVTTRITGVNEDAPICATGKATVNFPLLADDGESTHVMKLEDVLCGDQIKGPALISMGRLTAADYKFLLSNDDCFIFDEHLHFIKNVK